MGLPVHQHAIYLEDYTHLTKTWYIDENIKSCTNKKIIYIYTFKKDIYIYKIPIFGSDPDDDKLLKYNFLNLTKWNTDTCLWSWQWKTYQTK